jgi:hypothetical protein
MADTDAPQMSPQAQIVYRWMAEEFVFLKKSQWATTNYLVLIYAALIWVGQHVEHSSWLSWFLSAIAIAAGVVATWLLIQLQCDLGRLRERTSAAEAAYFSPNEREHLTLRPHEHPFRRGWQVLAALIAVCVVGAVLVVLALNLPPRST